ncbi:MULTISPECIES: helix-turn-helix domain-containing protein [unclassified Ruegeria]|uniref:helix-turn-helix domain-containing protein n=1 Tax=unclassified Ruegeria TaxID=2625375 RepID=UPI00149182E8|nr:MULTISPECIES: helix-turn-helix domain-containing protein [unclassified Ruegeria]NOD37086.1 helix-turn-helix domain-containing protein [Ruegeria sp. HKCCD7296]NOE44248.1 helix-turn-helix domain-containing protein [Ruegeria sp. HKCCD7319]
MLLFEKIRSVEHLPDYTDVQLEALALSPQGPKLNWRVAQHNGFSLYSEEYLSRIRFHEVQHGDTVFLGLVLPNGEPVRFQGTLYEDPFLVCWQGKKQTEYDYVTEAGTQIYVLEVPCLQVEKRGWATFKAPIRLSRSDALNAYARCIEKWLCHKLTTEGVTDAWMLSDIFENLENLAGEFLYRAEPQMAAEKAGHSQWKTVVAAEEYFSENPAGIKLTVQELCRELGVSRRSLFLAFEKQLGVGPSKFQSIVQLHRLRSLLLESTYEKGVVSKLIGEAGFSHLGRTSVAYRQFFGETPIETATRPKIGSSKGVS